MPSADGLRTADNCASSWQVAALLYRFVNVIKPLFTISLPLGLIANASYYHRLVCSELPLIQIVPRWPLCEGALTHVRRSGPLALSAARRANSS